MLCGRHHSAVHSGIWGLTVHEGIPWAVPPPWVDPERRPLRSGAADDRHQATRLGQQLRRAVDPSPPEP
jgi:hypothetical protein